MQAGPGDVEHPYEEKVVEGPEGAKGGVEGPEVGEFESGVGQLHAQEDEELGAHAVDVWASCFAHRFRAELGFVGVFRWLCVHAYL